MGMLGSNCPHSVRKRTARSSNYLRGLGSIPSSPILHKQRGAYARLQVGHFLATISRECGTNRKERMTKIIRLFAVIALACASAFAGEQNTKTQSLNESARGFVGTGDKVVIVGIIVSGKDTARVVFRAIGPELNGYGLSPVLQDPVLEIHAQDGSLIVAQDSYLENNTSDAQEIADVGLTPQSQNDCAIIRDLAPGNYTAIIRGKNGATGFALAEIYKLQLL
jgi:hypothetical protein